MPDVSEDISRHRKYEETSVFIKTTWRHHQTSGSRRDIIRHQDHVETSLYIWFAWRHQKTREDIGHRLNCKLVSGDILKISGDVRIFLDGNVYSKVGHRCHQCDGLSREGQQHVLKVHVLYCTLKRGWISVCPSNQPFIYRYYVTEDNSFINYNKVIITLLV